MIARWLPAPSLSIALLVVWLLLNQSLDAATLLLAAILAIAVPLLTQSLRPARARLRRPAVVLRLSGAVAYDLVESALGVARLLLTRRSAQMSPRFVRVPLELRDPNALAVLAMIICLTPGTPTCGTPTAPPPRSLRPTRSCGRPATPSGATSARSSGRSTAIS